MRRQKGASAQKKRGLAKLEEKNAPDRENRKILKQIELIEKLHNEKIKKEEKKLKRMMKKENSDVGGHDFNE